MTEKQMRKEVPKTGCREKRFQHSANKIIPLRRLNTFAKPNRLNTLPQKDPRKSKYFAHPIARNKNNFRTKKADKKSHTFHDANIHNRKEKF